MEFRQLEAFKLISETGSFSEAARLLGLTQPTISVQISTLEREFGCQLLYRQPGKVTPTETGQVLYRYASEILTLRDKAVATCGSHKEMSGTITIAASSIPFQFVLPVLTAQFSMKYPDACFTLIGGDSASTANLVLTGKADLGMVGTIFPHQASEDLEYEALLEDELMVVTPASEPYSHWSQGPAEISDVLQAPFVAREEGSGTWAEVEQYLQLQGYDSGALRLVARIDNPDVIVKSVEQGLGITILSSLAANDYRRQGNVLVFPLAGESVRRKIYLVRTKGKKLPRVTETFARFAAQRADNG